MTRSLVLRPTTDRRRLRRRGFPAILAVAAATAWCAAANAEIPAAVAVPGAAIIATAHAEGAQVYDCKPDAQGQNIWQFREPIATLMIDGKTVGRHYEGPSWELKDGGAVTAKAAGRAPGATAADIPWLKLDVATRRGSGQISAATKVQRLNTQGGALEGACSAAGATKSVPYAADYVFLKD